MVLSISARQRVKNTSSVLHYQYSTCAYGFAFFYSVRQHFLYVFVSRTVRKAELFCLEKTTVLHQLKGLNRNVWVKIVSLLRLPVSWRKWRRLKAAMSNERTAPNCCFSSAELAVRLTKRSGRHEDQKMTNVMFGVFFVVKDICQNVKKAENCERLATARTHDAVGKERFHQYELRRPEEGPSSSGVLYRKHSERSSTEDVVNRICFISFSI